MNNEYIGHNPFASLHENRVTLSMKMTPIRRNIGRCFRMMHVRFPEAFHFSVAPLIQTTMIVQLSANRVFSALRVN